MLRSSPLRTLTDKSQLAPVSVCTCAAAKGESASSAKTNASNRAIFPLIFTSRQHRSRFQPPIVAPNPTHFNDLCAA